MDEKGLQIKPENQQLQVHKPVPHFSWPTSKPGPQAMLPPPGQSPMPTRTDQMVEIGYNQETGTPSTEDPLRSLPDATIHGTTGFDQPGVPRKRRK